MQGLEEALNNLTQAVSSNSLPMWARYISAFGPLVLSVVIAIMTWIQHIQNQGLQKSIHNRDVCIQSRENILQIYNAFCSAQQVTGIGILPLATTLSTQESITKWTSDLFSASSTLFQVLNQASLFWRESDPDFVKALEEYNNLFQQFYCGINEYIRSGKATGAIDNAWTVISSTYGIPVGNTWVLWQRSDAFQTYIQQCNTAEVKQLEKQGEAFLSCLTYDKFDKLFEKYLKIDEID